MQAGIEQEQDEVASVPPSYASSHPGAVVVVLLDAEATDAAVERPWRPQDLARVAVGKLLVVALELLSEDASILLIHRIDIVLGQKFEGIGAEERLNGRNAGPRSSLLLEIAHDFLGCFVADTILLVVVDLFGPELGYDPRLCA